MVGAPCAGSSVVHGPDDCRRSRVRPPGPVQASSGAWLGAPWPRLPLPPRFPPDAGGPSPSAPPTATRHRLVRASLGCSSVALLLVMTHRPAPQVTFHDVSWSTRPPRCRATSQYGGRPSTEHGTRLDDLLKPSGKFLYAGQRGNAQPVI